MILKTDRYPTKKDGAHRRTLPRHTHHPGKVQPPILLPTDFPRQLLLIHHMGHHRFGRSLGRKLLLRTAIPMQSHPRLRPVWFRSRGLALHRRLTSLLFPRNIRRPHRYRHICHLDPIRVAAAYETVAKNRRERHLRTWLPVS